jgi:hypothetical protein
MMGIAHLVATCSLGYHRQTEFALHCLCRGCSNTNYRRGLTRDWRHIGRVVELRGEGCTPSILGKRCGEQCVVSLLTWLFARCRTRLAVDLYYGFPLQ